jgi:hypothetical protein
VRGVLDDDPTTLTGQLDDRSELARRIARVRSLATSSTPPGSSVRSPARTSQKTGRAPQCTTTFAVAGQVIGGTMTSSPGPIPAATSERWSAAVPDETATACFAPV